MSHGLQTKLMWKNNNHKLIKSLTDGRDTPESENNLDLEKVDHHTVFYVERIVETRLKKDCPVIKCMDHTRDLDLFNFEFLIKWSGFGPQHNTWEPFENLGSALKISAQNAVKKFLTKHTNEMNSSLTKIEDTNECESLKLFIDNTYEWDSLKTTVKNTINYIKDLESSKKETNDNNSTTHRSQNSDTLIKNICSKDDSIALFHKQESDTDDKTTNTNTVDHSTLTTTTITARSNYDMDSNMKKRKRFYDREKERLRAKYLKLKKENFPPRKVIGKKKNKGSKKCVDETNPIKQSESLNKNHVISSPYRNSSSKEKLGECHTNEKNGKSCNYKYSPLNEEKELIKVLKSKSHNIYGKNKNKYTKIHNNNNNNTNLVPFSKDYKNQNLFKKCDLKEDRRYSSNNMLVNYNSDEDYQLQHTLSPLSDISTQKLVSAKNGFHKTSYYNSGSLDCNEHKIIRSYHKEDEYKNREIWEVTKNTMITNFEDQKNPYIVCLNGDECSLYQRVDTVNLRNSESFKEFIKDVFLKKSIENEST